MTREIKKRQKFDDDVMSENCDVSAIFPIHDQLGAIWKPDYRCITCKTYIFINSNLLSYENWKQNWKVFNRALTLLLWVKVLFWPRNADFFQKMLTSTKGPWYYKVYFLKLHMSVYLRVKFQVSSITLTSQKAHPD